MTYSGGCACGAVRITVTAEPVAVRQCWCRDCQQLAAGHATVNAIFATDAIACSGTVTWKDRIAASGNKLSWGFCGECGTQLFAHSSARPEFRVVRLGAIDEPHGLAPDTVIWTDQAPAWARWPDGIAQHGGQPPAAPSPQKLS